MNPVLRDACERVLSVLERDLGLEDCLPDDPEIEAVVLAAWGFDPPTANAMMEWLLARVGTLTTEFLSDRGAEDGS